MLTFNFSPFPTLTTERLTLRQLTAADAPALFELRSDPAVMQFIPRPLAAAVADATLHIAQVNELVAQNLALNWGISLRDAPAVIGTIGYYRLQPENFRAELGYLLHPAHQGQGLMSEAVAAVLDYGFRVLNLHSVEGVIDPRNGASAQVLMRADFVLEGYFRENGYWDGKFTDTAIYSLLNPASHR